MLRIHIAHDHQGQSRRREASSVKRPQRAPVDLPDRMGISLARAAVRMVVGIEDPKQALKSHGRGVVLVLPDAGEHLIAALLDLVAGKHRTHDDVPEDVEHSLEILGEAGATDGEKVAVGGDPQGHAPHIQCFGNFISGSALGSTVHRARQQVAQPIGSAGS